MNYPKKSSYLLVKKLRDGSWEIEDMASQNVWSCGEEAAKLLRAMDGKTDPFQVFPDIPPRDICDMLARMEEEGFFDEDWKCISIGFGSVMVPLWRPKVTGFLRSMGAIYNRLLMLSWLPVLIRGVFVLLSWDWKLVTLKHGVLWGYILGLGLGLFLHELSHAASCIGYGRETRFWEMGVMLHKFLPGAYVLIDYSSLHSRLKRAQICGAGIECNALICGANLWALKLGWFDTDTLLITAFLNGMMALLNISLISGLDGMNIISELLGAENLADRAVDLTMSLRRQEMLIRRFGMDGKAAVALSYVVSTFQILLPVVLTLNVLSLLNVMR